MLREGMAADIAIYAMAKLAKPPGEIAHDVPADEWRRISRAEGYRSILVNGEATFVAGDCTDRTPGKLLRHGQAERFDYAIAAE